MSFTVGNGVIDVEAFRAGLDDHSCGAAVFFEGRVRNHNEGQAVDRLEYEIYEPIALSEGQRIVDEASQRWNIERAAAIHRGGLLALGDVAVIVGVVSAHRDEAFQAARYIIDEAKHRLPIWKREHYRDGSLRWVNCQRCGQAHGHEHSVPLE
jgi:molybdopterin synthase catalytic subunit